MKIIEVVKKNYHENIVRPLREGHQTFRLYQLNNKKRASEHARWYGFSTGLGGPELTGQEHLERTKLILWHWIRETLGDQHLAITIK